MAYTTLHRPENSNSNFQKDFDTIGEISDFCENEKPEWLIAVDETNGDVVGEHKNGKFVTK